MPNYRRYRVPARSRVGRNSEAYSAACWESFPSMRREVPKTRIVRRITVLRT